jgi:hypothetical protein
MKNNKLLQPNKQYYMSKELLKTNTILDGDFYIYSDILIKLRRNPFIKYIYDATIPLTAQIIENNIKIKSNQIYLQNMRPISNELEIIYSQKTTPLYEFPSNFRDTKAFNNFKQDPTTIKSITWPINSTLENELINLIKTSEEFELIIKIISLIRPNHITPTLEQTIIDLFDKIPQVISSLDSKIITYNICIKIANLIKINNKIIKLITFLNSSYNNKHISILNDAIIKEISINHNVINLLHKNNTTFIIIRYIYNIIPYLTKIPDFIETTYLNHHFYSKIVNNNINILSKNQLENMIIYYSTKHPKFILSIPELKKIYNTYNSIYNADIEILNIINNIIYRKKYNIYK